MKVKRVKKVCKKCGHKRMFLKIKNNMKRFRCGYCRNIFMEEIKNEK